MLSNGAVKDVIANRNGTVKGVLFGMIGSCGFILLSQLVWIVAVIVKDLNDPERLAKRAKNITKRTAARKQLNAAKIAARTAEKQMELDRQRADAPVNKAATKRKYKSIAELEAFNAARTAQQAKIAQQSGEPSKTQTNNQEDKTNNQETQTRQSGDTNQQPGDTKQTDEARDAVTEQFNTQNISMPRLMTRRATSDHSRNHSKNFSRNGG